MPQPLVLQEGQGLREAIQSGGSLLGNLLQQRKQQQSQTQQAQGRGTLVDVLSKFDGNINDPKFLGDLNTALKEQNVPFSSVAPIVDQILSQKIKGIGAQAPGGISAQPVPSEVSASITEILNENKDSTADELSVKFDAAGVPRAFSNSLIETRRRKDEQGVKSQEIDRKEQLQFHKESQKFDEKLSSKADSAGRKIKALERQEEILPNITNANRFFASVFSGSNFEDLFKAKSAQEFDSLALPLIEGAKDNFGVRLSDADLRLVLQKIATSTKNPEANKSIIEWTKLESKLDIEKRKVADEIKKENRGLRPIDFEDQLRVRMDERFGDEIQTKSDAILSLQEDPSAEIQFTERVKVTPGTPVTPEAVDIYLKLSNNDLDSARKMALEDGYVF